MQQSQLLVLLEVLEKLEIKIKPRKEKEIKP
jgi:hypothetical protein